MSDEIQVDESLIQSVQSAATLEQLHNLLRLGTYPGEVAFTVVQMLEYVKGVHTATMEAVKEHPQYDLLQPSAEIETAEEAFERTGSAEA